MLISELPSECGSQILRAIRAEKNIRGPEIVAKTNMIKDTVYCTLNRLEASDFVEVNKTTQTNRHSAFSLTEKGLRILPLLDLIAAFKL